MSLFPPIPVLQVRQMECDSLRSLWEDERKKSARILAQRDRLAEAVRELLDNESDDCQCGFVYRCDDIDDLREALAELDKEKQS